MNTTTNITEQAPRHVPRDERRHHTVVTTENTYDIMEEVDAEPEIAFISPASGYVARFEDGSTRPLALWVIPDDGRFYGVALPEDGKPPLELDNVEDEEGFRKYEHHMEVR